MLCYTLLQLKLLLAASAYGLTPLAKMSCGEMSSRREIRTVSATDRSRLLEEYKRQRRAMGSHRFATAMKTDICDIVRRIDEALAPKQMPYWDATWDLRLSRPADSVMFSDSFFPSTRRRRTKKRRNRESLPRGLSAHFRRMHIDASLTPAIRANRAAQLLVILYQLGRWRDAEGGCHACVAQPSTMAFCDPEKLECVSRVVVTANCSEFPSIDPCYASKCTDDICLAPEMLDVEPRSTRVAKKKLAARAVTIKRSSRTTTTASAPVDTVELLLSGSGADLAQKNESNAENSSLTTRQLESQSELKRANSVESEVNSEAAETVTRLLDSARNFYDISGTDANITIETLLETSKPTVPGELSHSNSTTPSTAATTSTSTSTTVTSRVDLPHFSSLLNTWVYPFDATLPYPSVYFSITIVAGPYRPRPRPQRSVAGVTVVSRGANLPSGYTHVVEALPLSDGHIVRVPDPRASGVVVEFGLSVLHDGRECAQMCLRRRRYIECARRTVRLSKFHGLTDPVTWYKTPRQAIEHQWKGAGYYRRRTQDAFIFTCSI